MDMDEQKSTSQESLRRLYKSSSDRIIDGVCGGIAEYLEIDSSVVRLLLVAFSILSVGAGILFYVIAMLIIPTKPAHVDGTPSVEQEKKMSNAGATAALLIGIIIMIIGVTLLFDYYDIFSLTSMWHSFGRLALPIIFILIGGALLLGHERKEVHPFQRNIRTGNDKSISEGEVKVERKRLHRSVRDKRISGVCGGLAEYFDMDSTIVRLLYVLLAFASFGLALLLYVVCAFVIPKESNS